MKVIIVGAGSMAETVASILQGDKNFQIVGFTDKDNRSKGKKILGIEVIGSHAILKDLFRQGITGMVVAIGGYNNIREKYFHEFKEIGFEMINVIHHSAIIDPSAVIGEGVIIGPGCIISPSVKIERNTILSAGVIISANVQIADNVYIGIGSIINGGSSIRRNAFLSAGCLIGPGVTIGKNAEVSQGKAVMKSIGDKARIE